MSKHLVVSRKKSRDKYLAKERTCPKCSLHIAMRRSTWCKHCVSEYERNRWASLSDIEKKEEHLWKKYKITFEDFKDMFDSQNGICATCPRKINFGLTNTSKDRACVDHDHATGEVRGLLCNHCNRALGLIEDNIETLKKMQEYLQ